MMFPTLSEMAERDMLEGNPVKKLQSGLKKRIPRNPFECKNCHYYCDSKDGLTHCPNCHLKI